MALAVNIQDPYKCPKASTWDSMTVETFVNQQMWTKGRFTQVVEIKLLWYYMCNYMLNGS